jgi:hypothetical protein
MKFPPCTLKWVELRPLAPPLRPLTHIEAVADWRISPGFRNSKLYGRDLCTAARENRTTTSSLE